MPGIITEMTLKRLKQEKKQHEELAREFTNPDVQHAIAKETLPEHYNIFHPNRPSKAVIEQAKSLIGTAYSKRVMQMIGEEAESNAQRCGKKIKNIEENLAKKGKKRQGSNSQPMQESIDELLGKERASPSVKNDGSRDGKKEEKPKKRFMFF